MIFCGRLANEQAEKRLCDRPANGQPKRRSRTDQQMDRWQKDAQADLQINKRQRHTIAGQPGRQMIAGKEILEQTNRWTAGKKILRQIIKRTGQRDIQTDQQIDR